MNRIGGPSGLPHSRTWSCRPPPPRTSWTLHSPGSSLVLRHRCHLVPPSDRGRRWIARRRRGCASGGAPYLPHRALLIVGRSLSDGALAPRELWRNADGVGLGQRRVRRTGDPSSGARAGARTARPGSGRTVLLVGEAGIGKSRLTSELARRAGEAGFEVLVGRSIDLVGTELPYQPFVDALRPLGERCRRSR